jgi:hypothetical protein
MTALHQGCVERLAHAAARSCDQHTHRWREAEGQPALGLRVKSGGVGGGNAAAGISTQEVVRHTLRIPERGGVGCSIYSPSSLIGALTRNHNDKLSFLLPREALHLQQLT